MEFEAGREGDERTGTRAETSGTRERAGGRRVRPPLSRMVRRVAGDTVALLRQELKLAQLELKENTTRLGMQMLRAAVWGSMAVVGVLALTASLIIGLGVLLGGLFWASALIVGGVFTAAGGLLARRAAGRIGADDLVPDETVESLKKDQRWARHEADELKRSLKEM